MPRSKIWEDFTEKVKPHVAHVSKENLHLICEGERLDSSSGDHADWILREIKGRVLCEIVHRIRIDDRFRP